MRMVLIGLGCVLAANATPTLAQASFKGEDRSGSQCKATDSKGNVTSGKCGTVCKGVDITTATGEDQASGYQYTCKTALTGQNGGLTDKWGLLGLLGLAGLLGLKRRDDHSRDRDDHIRTDTTTRRA